MTIAASRAIPLAAGMVALALAVAGCTQERRPDDAPAPPAGQPGSGDAVLQEATIVGSAETPDPVLERVRALEREGRVRDVVVMESFPVQIRLRAPKDVIDELQAMPRKGGLR